MANFFSHILPRIEKHNEKLHPFVPTNWASQLLKTTGMYLKQTLEVHITNVGLNRTGHMSVLTRQDWTPKFAGQVLPNRTESGLIFQHFT